SQRGRQEPYEPRRDSQRARDPGRPRCAVGRMRQGNGRARCDARLRVRPREGARAAHPSNRRGAAEFGAFGSREPGVGRAALQGDVMELQGQRALVTGASRGIGKAVALMLGTRGALVVGTATTAAGAQSISDYLRAAGVHGGGAQLDVKVESNGEGDGGESLRTP